MNKKRIILHVCILLLATMSISCFARAFYLEDNLPMDGVYAKENYADAYNNNVAEIINYVNAQIQYREEYSDKNRVVIENEEFGNVTVADLLKLYDIEKRSGDDADISYESTVSGKVEQMEMQMENEEDITQTKEFQRQYQYYKKLETVLDDFIYCVDTLTNDRNEKIDEENGLDLEQLSLERQRVDEEQWGYQEFRYSICYQIGEQEYILSNVEDVNVFEKEQYESVACLDNGRLVMKKNSYDLNIDLIDSFFNREPYISKRIKSIDFAVDAGNEVYEKYSECKEAYGEETAEGRFYFSYCRDGIVNAPSQATIQKIEKDIMILLCIAIFTILVSFIPYVLLILMAGHKVKGDVPQARAIDRGWMDVGIFVFISVYTSLSIIVFDEIYEDWQIVDVALICTFILGLSAVELAVLFSESFARRMKTKTLLDTTLLGKLWKLLKKEFVKLGKIISTLFENTKIAIKVVIVFIIAFVWNIIQLAMIENFEASNFLFGTLLTICIPLLVLCCLLWTYFSEKQIIVQGTKKISEGEMDYKIEEPMKFSSNRVLAKQINEIGAGLNKAVEDSVKNERMKTELITNVSHDLKTPLTSIINYIDLLKTDGLNSEKAEKYLDILDQKSQRLKNLTEDLVEASKLNSGVAKMEMRKLDLVQLVNQSLAEYDERFKKRKLQIVKTVQEEPIYVMADGRKTWRLLDNLYNNVAKYAMSGTRVYVDISTTGSEAAVSVKNISESALNFNAEELMERFVRGDVSRNTEGSGLGLSIAKSIAERQNGDLEIVLDGDLFKVVVTFDLLQQGQK